MNTKASLSDDEIIELYFARNERAIKETENKYARLLYTVAYRFVGDGESAKECQNDAYLALWNRIPPERPRNLQAYLVKIVRHLAIKRYQKESAAKRVPSELTLAMQDLEYALPADGDPASALEEGQLAAALEHFVKSLDPKRRYVFIERYYMAGRVCEIAATLGVSESAVYKELDKIKKKLKEYLERNELYL